MNREDIKRFALPFYNSSTRFFHNWSHIQDGLSYEHLMNNEQYIAWLFHDIIYLAGFSENEEASAKYLENYILSNDLNVDHKIACQIILDTKNHKTDNYHSQIVQDIDMLCFSHDYNDFVLSRINIAKEYIPFYGEGKVNFGIIDFLKSIKNEKIYLTDDFKHLNDKAYCNIEQYIKEYQ